MLLIKYFVKYLIYNTVGREGARTPSRLKGLFNVYVDLTFGIADCETYDFIDCEQVF